GQPVQVQEPAREAPVAKSPAAPGLALETAIGTKPRPAPQEAQAATVVAQQAPKPEASTLQRAPEVAQQAPMPEASAPQGAPEVAQEAPVRPQERSPAPAREAPTARGTALEVLTRAPQRTPDVAPDKSGGKLARRTREEREFLPAALEIVDTPPSPVG